MNNVASLNVLTPASLLAAELSKLDAVSSPSWSENNKSELKVSILLSSHNMVAMVNSSSVMSQLHVWEKVDLNSLRTAVLTASVDTDACMG